MSQRSGRNSAQARASPRAPVHHDRGRTRPRQNARRPTAADTRRVLSATPDRARGAEFRGVGPSGQASDRRTICRRGSRRCDRPLQPAPIRRWRGQNIAPAVRQRRGLGSARPGHDHDPLTRRRITWRPAHRTRRAPHTRTTVLDARRLRGIRHAGQDRSWLEVDV